MAAVLACSPGAVLSHRSAAALWELLTPKDGPVEVAVPTLNGRRRRVGIRIYRRAGLPPGATTIRDLIPATTPWKTIEDLEGTVEPHRRRQAIRQARFAASHLAPALMATGRAATWRATSCDCAAATTCRSPRSTSGSGAGPSTSSGRRSASRSRPTPGGITAAASPSRTITSATSACVSAATPSTGSRNDRSTRNRSWSRPTRSRHSKSPHEAAGYSEISRWRAEEAPAWSAPW